MELTAVKNDEIKEDVVAAYNEVLHKLSSQKLIPTDEKQREQQEIKEKEEEKIAEEKANVLHIASRETPDDLVKNLSNLKHFVGKTLDDVKEKLLPELEKFFTLRQAISFSQEELDELYHIKVNAQTLTALVTAHKEKTAAYEREIADHKQQVAQEKLRVEALRQKEESEYILRRDAARKLEQEQFDARRQEAERALAGSQAAFDEECESREARLAAREKEHQQMKEREARIIAREQEYQQFKEKVDYFPEELRLAVQKAERTVFDQLTRKYEYDAKLAHIELESERKMYQQKITALEEQIEQYKELKQLFSQSQQASLSKTSKEKVKE